MPKQQLTVMISSTARDLPEHRQQVMDACLRQGMFPIMMEHLPASDAEAIAASLKMVDEADIYVLILAHRYGYLPKVNNPQQISITEMEYNRAVERKIRRAVFIVDKTQSLSDFTIDDIDTGENAIKLKNFKERCEKGNIVNSFRSSADLRAHAIYSLSQHRESDLTTFHYVSDIPAPPEAFIAHPYTLLQTHKLVGRQPELNLLTDWVTKPDSDIFKARILNIVAIGGLGKSALTWKWFNDIAPQEMKPLAGRMWWSFYESDASFENFLTRALAYVNSARLDEVQKMPAPEREAQLLAVLAREPFLIVLDGLERMLIAYARMDASHLSDDDYDKQTANYVANAIGLPASAAQSFTGEHRLRKTADPRAGAFLRKLSGVRASRILVSTRLYPADLQIGTGEPWPGSAAKFLIGLANDEALELWRAFGVSGQRDSLLPIFNRVDNHPLLIQALASEVAGYRAAPGNFDEWQRTHPDFDPFSLPLVQVKSHVLEFALRGLSHEAREALQVIAGFRMPARYDALHALLVGEGKACTDEHELDTVLSDLEDRGLVGWDKRGNRYDLHPIVRGVVWSGLTNKTRRGVYESLRAHFEALPKISQNRVSSLEELTPSIELYHTLIGLRCYDDAATVYRDRLSDATLYRVSASRQSAELLEMLFPDGLDRLPCLDNSYLQTYALQCLALAYQISGQPGKAAALYRRAVENSAKDIQSSSPIHGSLSDALRISGALRQAVSAGYCSLVISRRQPSDRDECHCLAFLALLFAVLGDDFRSRVTLDRSLRVSLKAGGYHNYDYQAERALLFRRFQDAQEWAERAAHVCEKICFDRGLIRAARLQGEAALGLTDLATGNERLHHALTRARNVNYVEEELPALVALAELRRRQGDLKAGRAFLDDVWELAERGPYPLFHADACNVLAQIERDAENTVAAVEAATTAYRLAWCDGPPFAYHRGLEAAKKHLKELGVPEPEMPPFDASKFEPMPEVEIDPDDEFHAGKDSSN